MVFNGVEGHCSVYLLRMAGVFRVELGLCRIGQKGFQARQVHRGMKVLLDGFGTIPSEVFKLQTRLEQTLERFNAPAQVI